jgi:hypothetical protein
MKQIGPFFILPIVLVIVIACVSTPPPEKNEPQEPTQSNSAPQPEPSSPTPPPTVTETIFDPGSISEEVFLATKADIQTLIEELNRIIRARNYDAWLGYLSDSYFNLLSSQDFLDEKTEDLYRRDQVVATNTGRDPRTVEKKILRTPRDYFNNVVVPSRSNDRVDDIAFVSQTHVRAYTVDSRGTRLILYELAIIQEKWKIIG